MRALIYGNGISGKGAHKLLGEKGIDSAYVDDNSSIDVLDGADMLVLSPSITLDKPLVREAEKRNIEVIGEIELGYRYAKGNIVAVTGTNGKTTTCMMLGAIMREAGKEHFVLGNIGKSFASSVSKTTDNSTTILEVSSFQLESIEDFRPHIAVMLNIGIDHIERHGSFEEYIKVKSDIFSNMQGNDIVVLNYDDSVVQSMASAVKADIRYFSMTNRVDGAYVFEKWIYYRDERLCAVKDLHLIGSHNVMNALAAITVAKSMGINNIHIIRALRTFSLPPHRIQFVGRYRKKNYYNDSKATNIEATISAVRSIRGSIALIIGGYDKGISYNELFKSLDKNVRSVIIFGQNKGKIEADIKNYDIRYYVEPTLLKAIERASRERVENVLFSPGTSSYDMFKNYEERGDMFVKLTLDINEE